MCVNFGFIGYFCMTLKLTMWTLSVSIFPACGHVFFFKMIRTKKYKLLVFTAIAMGLIIVFAGIITVMSSIRKPVLPLSPKMDQVFQTPFEFEGRNGIDALHELVEEKVIGEQEVIKEEEVMKDEVIEEEEVMNEEVIKEEVIKEEVIEETSPPFNQVVTRCKTNSSFSLFFRGIKHYKMIMHHFKQAVFLLTIDETKEFGERQGQMGGYFVILLTVEDLVSCEEAADIELQISEHLRKYYVMFPPGLAIPNSIRSIFTSKSYVTEIQPTIQFTSDEMNIERIGDAFEFNGIILVDMTITEPMPLFFALETKLDRQFFDAHTQLS